MKWALLFIAIALPCAIVALFVKLEFASAMIASFALIAVVFFASLPWIAGTIYDRGRAPRDRMERATVVKSFDAPVANGAEPQEEDSHR